MNLASVTITMDDFINLDTWHKYYLEYKDALTYHIVVDNNSTLEYKKALRQYFPDSIIIERNTNGGTTAAYNDGIRYAIQRADVDAVMLIANDIDISTQGVQLLYNKLGQKEKIGAISPILLNPDKKTVLTHGELLAKDMGLIRLHSNMLITEEMPKEVISECLPGGMVMIKKRVIEQVGYQDESLFMYMDENDYFYRVRQQGFELVSIRDAVASHCHISTEGKQNDNSLAWFYINRNHLLVCRKYKSFLLTFSVFIKKIFIHGAKRTVYFILEGSYKKIYYYYLGLMLGLIGYRKNFVTKKRKSQASI